VARRTPYSAERAAFSEQAHLLAQSTVYPRLFAARAEDLSFENTNIAVGTVRARILDGEMAIDRIVRVATPDLAAPLVFTIQERFREMRFARYQDMTVTEWNISSGLPSELFKINSGFFIYGYYDASTRRFGEVIAVDVPEFLRQIATGNLPWKRRVKAGGQQTFLTFSFRDLEAAGALVFRLSRCRDGLRKRAAG
jgi:hypothetical protein